MKETKKKKKKKKKTLQIAASCGDLVIVSPSETCGSGTLADADTISNCSETICSLIDKFDTARGSDSNNGIAGSGYGPDTCRIQAVDSNANLICIKSNPSHPWTATDETWNAPDGKQIQLKRLTNTKTLDTALIATSNGGRIEQLKLSSNGGILVDMLAGNHHNASAMQDRTNYRGCSLMPWANRIEDGKYTFFDEKYQLPINENHGVRHHALHGFLFYQNMTIDQKIIFNEHSVILKTTKSFTSSNSYPGYPFKFTINIEYNLNSSSFFNIKVTAINTDADDGKGSAMPFYMGWHPFFKVKSVSETCIEFDKNVEYSELNCGGPPHGDQLIANATLIPTGRSKSWKLFDGKRPIGTKKVGSSLPNYYDTAFRISNPDLSITRNKIIDSCSAPYKMVLWQDSNFRFNQMYTGLPSSTGEEAVAFEPQSGSINSYNNGDDLSVLYPGQSFTGEFGFYVE